MSRSKHYFSKVTISDTSLAAHILRRYRRRLKKRGENRQYRAWGAR